MERVIPTNLEMLANNPGRYVTESAWNAMRYGALGSGVARFFTTIDPLAAMVQFTLTQLISAAVIPIFEAIGQSFGLERESAFFFSVGLSIVVSIAGSLSIMATSSLTITFAEVCLLNLILILAIITAAIVCGCFCPGYSRSIRPH